MTRRRYKTRRPTFFASQVQQLRVMTGYALREVVKTRERFHYHCLCYGYGALLGDHADETVDCAWKAIYFLLEHNRHSTYIGVTLA